jgi:hypothetical protein
MSCNSTRSDSEIWILSSALGNEYQAWPSQQRCMIDGSRLRQQVKFRTDKEPIIYISLDELSDIIVQYSTC